MNDNVVIAQQCFLDNHGLHNNQLESLLGLVAKRDVDAADIYFQSSRYESWVLEDGIIKEGGFSRDMGAGIRAVSGEKTGFAYTDQIQWKALEQAAKSAREIAGTGHGSHSPIQISTASVQRYNAVDPIKSLPEAEKINLLKHAESIAFAQNAHVKRVTVSLTGAEDIVMVVDLDGKLSADVRPLIRLNLSVIVEKDGRIEQGHFGGGGRFDYHYFIENNKAEAYAKEAVRLALVNLEAVDAPAGNMPVVLGPGWPGVLLHEAVGHGLEGDFNRKGSSFYSGKIGEKVASSGVTIVDDGTLADRRGSLSMDDEGTQTQSTTLIEDGVLKGYLFDNMNARLMNTQSTGNGRRESYAHLPMPRMTNTYMLAGDKTPEEILASIDKGVYAVNFSGGQVDITSGKFVFSASEAYMVEKGKIKYPIKGATLIGSGHEVMQKVSMIGNDLELDAGVGVCGKEGQSVPVGVGQPTLKIDEIIVGGTEV